MSAVGAAAQNWGLVDLNVRNVQLFNIEALNLSVALSVLQEIQQEAARLFGPATLSTANFELLSHSLATNASVEATERNDILVLDDIVQISLSTLQAVALEGNGSFTSVLLTLQSVRKTSKTL